MNLDTARPYRTQWLVLAIALLTLAAPIGYSLHSDYRFIDARERDRLQVQARVVEVNLGRQLEGVNHAMAGVRDEFLPWRGKSMGQEASRRLMALRDAMPGVRAMGVFDSKGTTLASSQEELIGKNLISEREFFKVPRAHPDADVLYVSPPFKSVLGVYSINVVRAVVDSRGEFAGIVAATLDPAYFEVALRSVLYTPEMRASVIHGDGRIVVEAPGRADLAGMDLAKPGSRYTQHLESGQAANVFAGTAFSTGDQRMSAWRTLRPASLRMDKPLMVSVNRDMAGIFAPWRRDAYVVGSLFGVVLLVASLGLLYYQRRQMAHDRLRAGYDAQRKLDEEALRDSAEEMRAIFEGTLDGILVADTQTRKLVTANAAICAMLGYTHEEILRIGVPDIHPKQDLQRVMEQFERQLRGEIQMGANTPVVRKDGTVFYADIKTAPIRLGGRDCLLGIFRDATERTQAEEALARESHRNQVFLRNASDGVHILDADGNVLEVSDSFCAMLGYAREELIGANVSLWDAQWSAQELKQVVAEQIVKEGRSIIETRHRRRDGKLLDVEITGQSLDLDGQRVLFNSARDITERNRARQKLVEAEAQFRGLVEQSIAGTYIIQDGRFAYVNPRFAEIFGYHSADELIGRHCSLVLAENEVGTVAEKRQWQIAGDMAGINFTFTGLRKDGSTIDVGVNGTRAFHHGRPAVIGLIQDISEKKRAEAEIRRYLDQLKTAFMSTVEVATTLSEMRDPYTAGHERRVAEIAVAIGAELGFDERRLEGLRVAGHLHDVGKITIPAEILSKPGKLSSLEFQLVKGHAQASYDVLMSVEFPWPVAQVALQHHERMDGSGYPQGLKGEEILLEARIMAVADVVEAMATHRPYRPGLGIDKALAEVERGRATAYDAEAVDACLRLFREKHYQLPS